MPAFRFEFVKAIGNTITNVKLPEGQEANAKTIKHVAGNGPIYICRYANTCPKELELPGCVSTFEQFKTSMDSALAMQKEGFGII